MTAMGRKQTLGRRSVVEEASAGTQDHGHEVQAELVDCARSEVPARYLRASVDEDVGGPSSFTSLTERRRSRWSQTCRTCRRP